MSQQISWTFWPCCEFKTRPPWSIERNQITMTIRLTTYSFDLLLWRPYTKVQDNTGHSINDCSFCIRLDYWIVSSLSITIVYKSYAPSLFEIDAYFFTHLRLRPLYREYCTWVLLVLKKDQSLLIPITYQIKLTRKRVQSLA